MKEIETTTTEIIVEETPGEEKSADVTTVEIVDTTMKAALDRRHHAIMARTIRIRATFAQNEVSLSNSHRITF